jgi:hypothetical protein
MPKGLEALLRAMERPCRIEASQLARPVDEALSWRRTYLRCERLPLAHLQYCFPGQFEERDVPAERADEFDKCLQWRNGVPDAARELIDLLTEGLVLPTGDNMLDLAIALDWYKIIEDGVDPMDWKNTPPGQLVAKAKYYSSPTTAMISDAIQRHPPLRDSLYLVSVPGSRGDGQSVGERIAASVADATGKVLIKTVGPQREPRKAGGSSSGLDGLFSLPTSIDGPCVVVDDVYKSGKTLRATALAARQAGATAVYGVVAAKTLSG